MTRNLRIRTDDLWKSLFEISLIICHIRVISILLSKLN